MLISRVDLRVPYTWSVARKREITHIDITVQILNCER